MDELTIFSRAVGESFLKTEYNVGFTVFHATYIPYIFSFHYLYTYISDRIRKNIPAVDSKIVPVARSVLTTLLAGTIPPTPACDRDISSRGPCQHRTFKQAQTTQQTQSITKLFGT